MRGWPAVHWSGLTFLRGTAIEGKVSGWFRPGGDRRLTAVKVSLSLSPSGDIVGDELHEVLIAITDHCVVDGFGVRLAGPSCLAGRSVAIQPCPGRRDPVVESLACVGKVAVPAKGGRAVLVGVVGAEAVQVQCGELPNELGMAMPEGRHDGRRESVRPSQPIHLAVELDPLDFSFLGGEQVPVDGVRRLGDERPPTGPPPIGHSHGSRKATASLPKATSALSRFNVTAKSSSVRSS